MTTLTRETQPLYGHSLALLTDLYQLTMAQGYWKHGRANREAVFHLFFRKNPFAGGYTIAAGLETALEFLERLRFEPTDIEYLSQLNGNDGQPLFEKAFLTSLGQLKLSLDIHAVPEGTVVFPHQPLMRVKGNMLECQIVETALLNMINFQSLIATKASRICQSAGQDQVLEFGTRRAQGIDGSLAASRAAFIGGCHATSNVLAGKLYDIPVKGTHAHSWVMSFDSELDAFEAYAEAMPNNCVFLVDTFDTLDGIRKAIEVGKRMRKLGHEMAGVRLDSGDLAYLSIEARKLLDESGFSDAVIVASNDLDERLIQSLKAQGAKISVWGVGTKLATAYDQPALGGVYKLGAMKDREGSWLPKIKLSEQLIKTSTPGILQVRRFFRDDRPADREAVADMILNELEPPGQTVQMVDPLDLTRRRSLDKFAHEDLLTLVMEGGRRTSQPLPLVEIRQRTKDQLNLFHPGIKRFENPHQYPVGLEAGLYELKSSLAIQLRSQREESV